MVTPSHPSALLLPRAPTVRLRLGSLAAGVCRLQSDRRLIRVDGGSRLLVGMPNICLGRPCGLEQRLAAGREGGGCTDVVTSSSSIVHLRAPLVARKRVAAHYEARFEGSWFVRSCLLWFHVD